MPSSPNKLSQFWQELKRRRVTRTITVYAAAAFVILELVSIIVEPLKLPEWTLPMIIVLLCVGFIIVVTLSWIYDVHPKEGIIKTESIDNVKTEDIPKSSSSWKLASYISFVVIVGLIVLNIIPRKNRADRKEILDKSIAVLPFINDSEDKGNEHIINGIMEEILINLQSIKELRVSGRTSVEQYRNNPKSIPEIASEMNVAYIVEGSGQKYANKIRLRVQLIEGATDKHLWADLYDEEINKPEDIFRIQSKIAQSIAKELQVLITPEEKRQIEKLPTRSFTAYELYQKGREEFYQYYIDKTNMEALVNAKNFYRSALKSDSAFARAYIGLGQIYWYQLGPRWYGNRPKNCLDSVLIMADIALSYDDQIVDGYVLRGDYYSRSGKRELAIEEYNKALILRPNHWTAYHQLGFFYLGYDYVKSIKYFYQAGSLIHGPEEPAWLRRGIWQAHDQIGFTDKSDYYLMKALKLDGDSSEHYLCSSESAMHSGNFINAVSLAKKGYAMDSAEYSILRVLGYGYLFLGQYEEAIKYLKECYKKYQVSITTNLLGYAYWKIEFEEEAEKHILENIRQLDNLKEQGVKVTDNWIYYGLAGGYAFLGEKEKAYENLRLYEKRIQIPSRFIILRYRIDPLLDSIRDEPEFQQIVKDAEARYQAEHERVRRWLEENGML